MAGVLDEYVNKFTALVSTDEWKADRHSQATKLRGLADIRTKLDSGTLNKLINLAATSLGLEVDRVKRILLLNDHGEILTALEPQIKEQPPDELFPREGWLADYLTYTSGTEVPTTWNFWCGLSVLASALKRNLFLDSFAFKIWPNLYLMIVEESASKKSTGIGFAKDIIVRLNKLLHLSGAQPHQIIPLAPSSGTFVSFIEAIQSRQIVTKDEFGGDLLTLADCTAYFSADDLVTLFSKASFHASAWVEGLTHLWDYKGDWERDSIASNLRNQGRVVLRNPSITFVGGTTIEWMRNSVTEAMVGGGFMSRCIYVIHPGTVEQLYPFPNMIDPVAAIELAEQLVPYALMQQRGFVMTPSYRDWYVKWYNDYFLNINSTVTDEKLRAYYHRRPVMLHKIAMLLAISFGRFQGLDSDLDMANKILIREEMNLEKGFLQVGAHQDSLLCDMVIRYIDKKGGRIDHSSLLNAFTGRTGGARKFRELISTLTESGRVKVERKKHIGGGVEYSLPTF